MGRKMKDSGVEWIGEIPTGWKIERLKNHFGFGKGLPITKENLTEKGVPVISYGQIHAKFNTGVTIHPDLIRFVPESYLNSNATSLVKKGDFIFADTSEDFEGCGNCTYVDSEMKLFAGYHTIIFISLSGQDNKYLAYLFKTDAWRKQIRSKVTGVKLFSISRRILSDATIIIPSENEQHRIASFLDQQCAEIDNVLQKTRESIEEYKKLKQAVITQAVTKGIRGDRKMKDSGIEWIGEIPEEWETSRVGLHYDIILGKMICSSPSSEKMKEYPYICAANVHFDGVSQDDLKKMWFLPEEIERYHIIEGDLLVVEGGAGAGGCAIAHGINEIIGIQNSIQIVRPKSQNDVRYLCYLLQSLVKRNYVDVVCNKATIPHFTKDKLGNVPYLVMSLEEQINIANHLDNYCSNIDIVVAKKESIVSELESYKKSLIYEYVTGKKEVPENYGN